MTETNIENGYVLLTNTIQVETVVRMGELMGAAIPISGKDVARARQIRKRRRETFVPADSCAKETEHMRIVAKHRGKRDSVMGMNRLSGKGC